MKVRPTENWYWYFDHSLDSLMLNLSQDMIFRSRFTKKMIVADAFVENRFSIEDAATYYQLYESCNLFSLAEPHKVELVLNALAARNFLKPQMPRSWYFFQQPYSYSPERGEAVCTQLCNSHQFIDLLTIDISDNASLCVIAQKSANLAGKILNLGDVIKIMHDRLIPKGNISDRLSHHTKDEDIEITNYNLTQVC
ncbi:MAG: cell division protein ZapC [Candidatus Schmidhempelia sp.]|nr:cell division protein ZapC [Candidatus Schmidhempelia sp.]